MSSYSTIILIIPENMPVLQAMQGEVECKSCTDAELTKVPLPEALKRPCGSQDHKRLGNLLVYKAEWIDAYLSDAILDFVVDWIESSEDWNDGDYLAIEVKEDITYESDYYGNYDLKDDIGLEINWHVDIVVPNPVSQTEQPT